MPKIDLDPNRALVEGGLRPSLREITSLFGEENHLVWTPYRGADPKAARMMRDQIAPITIAVIGAVLLLFLPRMTPAPAPVQPKKETLVPVANVPIEQATQLYFVARSLSPELMSRATTAISNGAQIRFIVEDPVNIPESFYPQVSRVQAGQIHTEGVLINGMMWSPLK